MQTWQANLAPRFTAGLSDYSFFQNWAVRGKSVKPKSSQIKRLIGTMHHNFSNCSSVSGRFGIQKDEGVTVSVRSGRPAHLFVIVEGEVSDRLPILVK